VFKRLGNIIKDTLTYKYLINKKMQREIEDYQTLRLLQKMQAIYLKQIC
jgi:hypothetical protein